MGRLIDSNDVEKLLLARYEGAEYIRDDIRKIPTAGAENKWVSVEERLPNAEEVKKNISEFIVQSDTGERFTCKFDSTANGYDNHLWCCNVRIIAWMPLPEPYRTDTSREAQWKK